MISKCSNNPELYLRSKTDQSAFMGAKMHWIVIIVYIPYKLIWIIRIFAGGMLNPGLRWSQKSVFLYVAAVMVTLILVHCGFGSTKHGTASMHAVENWNTRHPCHPSEPPEGRSFHFQRTFLVPRLWESALSWVSYCICRISPLGNYLQLCYLECLHGAFKGPCNHGWTGKSVFPPVNYHKITGLEGTTDVIKSSSVPSPSLRVGP